MKSLWNWWSWFSSYKVRIWIRKIRRYTHCPFGYHKKYEYMEHPTQKAFDKLPIENCLSCKGKKLFT